MTTCFAFMIRPDILRELMKNKEFAEKLHKAKDWHEVGSVVSEFAVKKGYKIAEVYRY